MGLIAHGPCFAHWTDNYGALPTNGAQSFNAGVDITPGVSHADGSAVEIMPALTHDCEFLMLGFAGFSNSGTDYDGGALLDVLIDPAGGDDWSEIITDLQVGYTAPLNLGAPIASPFGPGLIYYFPLWVPAGASLGARARIADADPPDTTPKVVAIAAGGNKNPASWWCGQRVETVGTMNTAKSRGQGRTSGGDGAFGSWQSLGSTLGARAGAIQFSAQAQVNPGTGVGGEGVVVNQAHKVQFGAGSSQIGPTLMVGTAQGETMTQWFPGPIFCDIPAGTQMQCRIASNVSAGFQAGLAIAAYVVQ